MARPTPQADVADPALVGGICAELLELRIGQRFAGDARPTGSAHRDNPAAATWHPETAPRRRSQTPAGSSRTPGSAKRRTSCAANPRPIRWRMPHSADRPMIPAVRTAMCEPEPQRPDRHQCRDQPLPRVGCGACHRPQRAAGPDQPDRKRPDGVDPAGIAGPLLHHPGDRHQQRQRDRDRMPGPRDTTTNVMQNAR